VLEGMQPIRIGRNGIRYKAKGKKKGKRIRKE